MWKPALITSLMVLFLCLTTEGRSLDSRDRHSEICREPEGFFPYPGLCIGDFYTCVDGVPFPANCPGDTVFDPVDLVCKKYDESSCRELPFECPDDKPGYYPIKPGQCSYTFWACVGGQPVEVKCPKEDEVFDEELSICVPVSSCKGAFTCPAQDGFFAQPGKCTSEYWECVGGVASPKICAGTGNVFDPETKVCVRLSHASCRDAFKCPEQNGRFPIDEDQCVGEFWICINGEPYLEKCPGTSIFDPKKLVCVSESDNPCNFRCPSLDGMYADKPGQCKNDFWICVGGKASPEKCPGVTSVFDPVRGYCVPIENASCSRP